MKKINMTRKELEILAGEREKYPCKFVEECIRDFHKRGFLSGGEFTAEGLKILEPYKVRRAIFVAAGMGERLLPITLNTPKPMVRVHGTRIIDRLIEACLAAEIEEIYIVRGYLAEQFDLLLKKYPMIRFIENTIYSETNNISSAICAKHLLNNAYVLEADLLLHNPALIRKYEFAPNFLGIKMARSDDWCFEVEDGIIVNQKVGGLNCWQEVGISYWDVTAGARLAKDLQEAFDMPGGHERYWDQVPLNIFAKNYRVEIRECKMTDIVEIDTFRELKTIDKAYNI